MHVTGLLDSIEITTQRQVILLDAFLATLKSARSGVGADVVVPADRKRPDPVADRP